MPLGRFKVEALNTNTGKSQEIFVNARGIAEAEEKVAALGFAISQATLVEVLDDAPPTASATSVGPNVASRIDLTLCPKCGENDWRSGKGAGAWTVGFLFFPIGLIYPLITHPRHECAKCHYVYSASTLPIGRVRSDGGLIAGLLYAIVIAAAIGLFVAILGSL